MPITIATGGEICDWIWKCRLPGGAADSNVAWQHLL